MNIGRHLLAAIVTSMFVTSVSFANPAVTAIVGKPEQTKLDGAALENETIRVGAKLRCPVCQGLSIADSPATMAVQMKQQVRELLAAGYSERQITEYFEKSYGQFVRLDPPRRGINWLVWLAPAAVLIGGVVVVWRVARRTAAMTNSPGEAEIDDLAPWLQRVREIAYGPEKSD